MDESPQPSLRARLSRDTSAAAERRQVEIWRAMPAVRKLAMVGEAREAMLALARAGIRDRNPTATEREIFLRLMLLTLGHRLACAAFPEAAGFLPPSGPNPERPAQ